MDEGPFGTAETLSKAKNASASGLSGPGISALLDSTCEREKWASEALAYNSLVIAWPPIARLVRSAAAAPDRQGELFG
jgi:putative DNA methylase